MLCRTTMKKLLLIALLITALTGCKEKTMNNELKPFDVQKEFPCSAGFAIQLLWNIRICNPIE